MVVHVFGAHLPLTTPDCPKHTTPASHGKFGISAYIVVA
jgi:hypothetical protein